VAFFITSVQGFWMKPCSVTTQVKAIESMFLTAQFNLAFYKIKCGISFSCCDPGSFLAAFFKAFSSSIDKITYP